MKLSINWLNNFLSLDELTAEEVAHKLTMGSFEVEEIQKVGPKLKGPILVGKILNIQKHPNADRLAVTRVTTDGKNEFVIVCGAKNIKEGQKVPVSLEGAVVVNRQDGSKLAIKTTKIREIESCGMLCSPGELGINIDDPNGILILPEDAKLGESVIDYLSLNEDIVLEVASRSNRGDALSVYGLSKEISALTKKNLKQIAFKTPKIDTSVQNTTTQIENLKDTYLFYTVTIEEIEVFESPPWLKRLLESVGIRTINNIVDITNYINFTFGQPLHAYDKAKLKGSSLIARSSKAKEKILTIDGKVRDLKEGVLVIADREKPVAIAGIMGSKDSEVTESTKTIVLEAAIFNPQKVRRGSRTVGLSSEASKRFERGVDSNFTYNALLCTIELIEKLATKDNTKRKPKIGKIEQAGKPLEKEIKIQLSKQEATRVLGIDLKIKEISELLELLQFKTKKLSEEEIEVQVPQSRTGDITRPIDLIEEVARLYGYDKIPSLPPKATLSSNRSNISLEKIKNYFLVCGFSESYLSSLIGEQVLNNNEFPFDISTSITMLNPLSKEHCILRQSLIPGLLEALKLNQNHQITPVKLFEIGKVYFYDKKTVPNEKETCVTEKLRIGGIIYGQKENWILNKNSTQKSIEHLFFNVKGILEGLFNKNNCNATFLPHKERFLHPSFSLKMSLNKNDIGVFGCLHPLLEKRMELLGPVIVFEINLEPILNELEKTRTYKKISSQPMVIRDITIDLSKKYEAGTITNEINKVISGFVISATLINVYELDKENRSLTYRLKMQDFEQTLTSQQIEDEVNLIKKHLSACFQAKFRV
ncbi:MAG: phenylalanine--tRNA ligase subunit beta [Candidatus Melainabacteria bacterium]|nr:phenylalanine--tRNA ligase subunit beta [Candidatus Melainabacteria bacterium]